MYRITKVLNHNTVTAVCTDSCGEYLIVGKGIGFGKKVNERIEVRNGDTLYSLQETTERGSAKKLASSISPEAMEIADRILNQAENVFGKIDRNILFPLADHIEYAVKRIRNHEQISNPLTDDIRVLFHSEFKVAAYARDIIKEKMGMEIEDDEIGYIALHVHSAIEDEKVSQAMQVAQAVRQCISLVEEEIGSPIDVMSLSYNRLMNHIRYMISRAITGEKLKINMNDYMAVKFPKAFQMAETICRQIGKNLRCEIEKVEIGYLAMHMERVAADEMDKKSGNRT